MLVDLDDVQLAYLRGKIRQDIRNRRRQLSRATPGDRTPAEFQDLLATLRNSLARREETFRVLGGDSRELEDRSEPPRDRPGQASWWLEYSPPCPGEPAG
jgi:hypothetical protein